MLLKCDVLLACLLLFNVCACNVHAHKPGHRRVHESDYDTTARHPVGLDMAEIGNYKIEGTYVEEDEDDENGIYFLCETNMVQAGKLLITTIEGDTVFSSMQLRDELSLTTVLDNTVLDRRAL